MAADLSEKEKEAFPSRSSNIQSNAKHHNKCVKRLEYSMRRSKSVCACGVRICSYSVRVTPLYTLKVCMHVTHSCLFVCRSIREVYARSYGEGWLVRITEYIFHYSILLSSSPVDMNKHVVCEPCGDKVLGGFDHHTNQVFTKVQNYNYHIVFIIIIKYYVKHMG